MIGSSSNNTGSDVLAMNPKAMEAELIQKATQTAIVAARSILMSGGTEESALKTAKAAAESVLNPAASDSDTVSGRSTLGNAFGGKRRKAKRQAEVVASMALMSATSLQPGGGSIMGDCDSVNKMYGRNIITVKQDEPSVLSGSTRPPKPPTPNSITSASPGGRFSFRGISQKKEVREPPEGGSIKSARPPLPPTSPTTPQSILSSAYNKLTGNEDETESRQLGIKTLSQSCSMDSANDSSVDSSLLDGSLLDPSLLEGIRSSSEDESDEETAAFFFEKRKSKANSKSKSKKNSSWSFSDAFVNPFAATLNILHCGQGTLPLDGPRMEYKGKDRKRSGKRSGRSRARDNSIVDSRDDTFDDDTAFSSNKRKDGGGYTDADFPHSYSYDSEITDISEQDLNIRSSIRETMESIVSKSRLSYRQSKKNEKKSTKSKPAEDKKWKSYESPKGRKSSSVASASSSPKHSLKSKKRTTAPKASRGRSFFRRK